MTRGQRKRSRSGKKKRKGRSTSKKRRAAREANRRENDASSQPENRILSPILKNMILNIQDSQTQNLDKCVEAIKSDEKGCFEEMKNIIILSIKNIKKLERTFLENLKQAVRRIFQKIRKKLKNRSVHQFFFKSVEFFGFSLKASNFQISRLFKELLETTLKTLKRVDEEEKKMLQSSFESASVLALTSNIRSKRLGIQVLVLLQKFLPESEHLLIEVLLATRNFNIRKLVLENIQITRGVGVALGIVGRDKNVKLKMLILERLKSEKVDFLKFDYDSRCSLIHFGLLTDSAESRAILLDYILNIDEIVEFEKTGAQFGGVQDDFHSVINEEESNTQTNMSQEEAQIKDQILKLISSSKKKKHPEELSQISSQIPSAIGGDSFQLIQEQEPESQHDLADPENSEISASQKLLSRLLEIVIALDLRICFKIEKIYELSHILMNNLFDRIPWHHFKSILTMLLDIVFVNYPTELRLYTLTHREVLFLLSCMIKYVYHRSTPTVSEPSDHLFALRGIRVDRLGGRLDQLRFDELSNLISTKLPSLFHYVEYARNTLLSNDNDLITKFLVLDLIRYLPSEEIAQKRMVSMFHDYCEYLLDKVVSFRGLYEHLRDLVKSKFSGPDLIKVPEKNRYLRRPQLKEICLRYFCYLGVSNVRIFFDFDLLSQDYTLLYVESSTLFVLF